MSKTVTKVAAASGLVAIFGAAAAMGAPAAVADSTATTTSNPSATDVATQVRKSVTLSGNPDGSIISSASAMVTQVSSVGNGHAQVSVPVGASSARNLDGFSSVPFEGENAIFNMNPNGNQEQRIYTKSSDGPIKVKVTATLDGKPINPGEVVDKTGVLAVNYNVVNTQTEKQTVTYKDVNGNDVVSEVEMASPIGGSVDIILPQGFNEITATGASVGGDGTGATKLSYSLVLFEPLGNRVANFGYQTRIAAGTLPSAEFTFLPIIPMENSTIASTKEAYSGGASTGATIHGAGVEIGENLTKLQDGAAELTAGLAKAADGASELADGLNNKVVPGANALASGADTLASGLSGDLNDGLTTLNAGLAKFLAGVNKLPQQVKDELAENEAYLAAMAGLKSLAANGATANGAVNGLYGVAKALNGNNDTGGACADVGGSGKNCLELKEGANLYITGAQTLGGTLYVGLPLLINELLNQIQATLLGVPEGEPAGLLQIVAGGQKLQAGVEDKIIPGANALAAGANTLADGLPAAADGATQIADGLPAAVDGTEQIEQGAGQLRDEGSDKLATSGETAQADYAYKVAQIDAIQQVGLSGSNIPYGPATGPNTQTTGVYQLTLSPASSGASNGLVFGLAALGLVVAGAAGVFVWRRVS